MLAVALQFCPEKNYVCIHGKSWYDHGSITCGWVWLAYSETETSSMLGSDNRKVYSSPEDEPWLLGPPGSLRW